MQPSVASVKLWSVPDDDREEQAAGRWRELFRRADRLEFAAPAVEKRRRGRVFERVIHGMLAEEGLAPRTNFRPAGEEVDGSFCKGEPPFSDDEPNSSPLSVVTLSCSLATCPASSATRAVSPAFSARSSAASASARPARARQ